MGRVLWCTYTWHCSCISAKSSSSGTNLLHCVISYTIVYSIIRNIQTIVYQSILQYTFWMEIPWNRIAKTQLDRIIDYTMGQSVLYYKRCSTLYYTIQNIRAMYIIATQLLYSILQSFFKTVPWNKNVKTRLDRTVGYTIGQSILYFTGCSVPYNTVQYTVHNILYIIYGLCIA